MLRVALKVRDVRSVLELLCLSSFSPFAVRGVFLFLSDMVAPALDLLSLDEWTRSAASWSPISPCGEPPPLPPLCALLRAGLRHMSASDLADLLIWFPHYRRLLRLLSNNPVVVLSPAGALLLRSAMRAARRFGDAAVAAEAAAAAEAAEGAAWSAEGGWALEGVASTETASRCRKAEEWCADFVRYLAGGKVRQIGPAPLAPLLLAAVPVAPGPPSPRLAVAQASIIGP